MVKKKRKKLRCNATCLPHSVCADVQILPGPLATSFPMLGQLTGSPSMWGETLLKYVLLFFT